MESQTNTSIDTAGVQMMGPGGLARQDPQTPMCPMCGSPGQSHRDSANQLHNKKMLHFCLHCNKCFTTVPNTKSNNCQMTGFYSVKIKKFDKLKEVCYQCIVCNKLFGTLPDRNAHMEKHMGVNTHMCTKCGFVSNCKFVIDAHMVTHTKEYSHKCPVCCKRFATSTDMDQHLKMHLGDSLHRCPQCSFASPDVQAQIMTISLVQSKAEAHTGMITQSISITYSYTSENKQPVLLPGSHEDQSSHFARPINSEDDTGSDHNYHEQGKPPSVGRARSEVHSVQSMSYQPRKAALQVLPLPDKDNMQVNKGVAVQSDVAKTLARGTGNKPVLLIPIGMAISTQGKVIVNNASVHALDHATVPFLHKPTKMIFKSQGSADVLMSPSSHRCSVCNKTFAHIQKLQAHMKLHAHGLIYKCPECGKKFNRSFNLKKHMASHRSKEQKDIETDKKCVEDKNHEADRDYEEDANYRAENTHDTCEKQEADKPHETGDKHETDNYQQPEKNDHADKNQEIIKDHEEGKVHEIHQNHDADKHHIEMYKCPVCRLTFEQKGHLNKHIENHSKLYKCPICSAKFKKRGWLKEHMEIHITCTLCQSYFSSPEELNNHILTHTARNEVKCMICFKWFSDLPEHMEAHPISDSTETTTSHSQDKVMVLVPQESTQSNLYTGESTDTGKPHMCSVCGKEFAKRVYLLIHKQLHKPQNAYVCSLCGHSTEDRGYLRNHLKRHGLENHREIRNACTLCKSSFLSPEELNNHILTHTARNEVKCMICFKWFSDLPEHMEAHPISDSTETTTSQEKVMVHVPQESVHSAVYKSESTDAGKPHTCSVCGKAFAKRVYLLIHKHLHEPQRVHVCSLCGHATKDRNSLKKHVKRHALENQHQCSLCRKTYSSNFELKTHMQIKHADRDMSKQCPICWKKFPHIHYLRKHMRGLHSEKKYTCLYCDKCFTLKSRLNLHMPVHQDKGDYRYECSTCCKCFRHATALRVHQMVHTEEKPFMCSVCGKHYKTKSSLNAHMLTHTGEKPHMCAICGKTFASRPRLNVHMKYHTLKKTHECSECGKLFYTTGNLKAHIRSHTDERPYLCSDCGRSFKTKRALQRHNHVLKRRGRKKKKTEYEELTETIAEHPGLVEQYGVSSYNQPSIPLHVGGNPEPYALTVEVVSDF